MSDLISESQALRTCNLPDTPHWRGWLRKNLQSHDVSTGRLYQRDLVEQIATKIAPMAGTPKREEPAIRFSGPVDSGHAASPKPDERRLENRLAPPLETR